MKMSFHIGVFLGNSDSAQETMHGTCVIHKFLELALWATFVTYEALTEVCVRGEGVS